MRKARVVLDTNVVVSGILSEEGNPARILNLWKKGAFTLVMSQPLYEEIIDTLTKLKPKYKIPERVIKEVAELMRDYSLWVELKHAPRVVRDPQDDVVIATATTAKADFLITGDKDILALGKTYRRVKIRKPKEFPT